MKNHQHSSLFFVSRILRRIILLVMVVLFAAGVWLSAQPLPPLVEHGPAKGAVSRAAIQSALTNDQFASARTLAGDSGFVRASNTDATKEPDEPNHAGNGGGASVWFRWTALTHSQVTWDTLGSGFDTLLAVYTGDSITTLKMVASNDDYGDRTSQLSFNAVAGSTYYIAVDGFKGAQGSVALRWAIPAANDHFADSELIRGERGDAHGLTFGSTVEAAEPVHAANPGGKSIWFYWRAPFSGTIVFDTEFSEFDTLLAVYTGDSLDSLRPVASNDDISDDLPESQVTFPAQAGVIYRIAIDGFQNPLGVVSEGRALLTWYRPDATATPSANDDFDSAQMLSGAAGSVAGTNLEATKETAEPDHAGDPGGRSVWYRWLAPTNGLAIFDTAGSEFDTVLAIYTGDALVTLTPVGANDDIHGASRASRVIFRASGGVEYRMAVDGLQTPSGVVRSGGFFLTWSFIPGLGDNDAFANAQPLIGGSGVTYGANVGATKEFEEPDHAGNAGGRSVWYRWSPQSDGAVTIDTTDSTFDTLLGVYVGEAVDILEEVASNDDADSSPFPVPVIHSQVTFAASAGQEYWIAVDGFSSPGDVSEGSIVLHWSQPAGTQPMLTITRLLPTSDLRLSLSGTVGAIYAIEYSSNFVSWAVLTNIAGAEGPLEFRDAEGTPNPQRFYRAKVLSP